jgi:hypothetical protein
MLIDTRVRHLGTRAAFAALTLMLAIAPAGCEEEKKASPVDAGAQDSGTSPLLGGKLGAAVAAAAAPGPSASAVAKARSSPDAPPENGVLGPAAADKAHPPGAPPKLEMLGEGAEPRVTLAPKLAGGAEQKLVLSLGLRAQVPLSLDVAISFKVEKPKDDKKKKDAASPAATAEAAAPLVASAMTVTGKVTSANVSIEAVPEDLAKLLASLKGSQIGFQMTPDGAASNFTHELAKGSDKGIDSVLKALTEGLSIILAPMPQKPVGVGGYWMVTDRAMSSGAEMVRYRVYRVVSAGPEETKLSIDLRQYSVETSLSATGPQGEMKLAVDKIDSHGKGEATWTAKSFLPPRGDVEAQTQAVVVPPGQTAQRGQVQTEVRLKITSN